MLLLLRDGGTSRLLDMVLAGRGRGRGLALVRRDEGFIFDHCLNPQGAPDVSQDHPDFAHATTWNQVDGIGRDRGQGWFADAAIRQCPSRRRWG